MSGDQLWGYPSLSAASLGLSIAYLELPDRLPRRHRAGSGGKERGGVATRRARRGGARKDDVTGRDAFEIDYEKHVGLQRAAGVSSRPGPAAAGAAPNFVLPLG